MRLDPSLRLAQSRSPGARARVERLVGAIGRSFAVLLNYFLTRVNFLWGRRILGGEKPHEHNSVPLLDARCLSADGYPHARVRCGRETDQP